MRNYVTSPQFINLLVTSIFLFIKSHRVCESVVVTSVHRYRPTAEIFATLAADRRSSPGDENNNSNSDHSLKIPQAASKPNPEVILL
jgi:hypothetical protein